ncbi:MAG: PqqD family peptide modification chaperone [Bacteroidales bacterium]|nr:PqqD family peptide modification chaperone [Bacteroidales bacterium]MDD3430991.1 PqqD family peptide modification chaperone [Bacteroidales bacterium]MDD4361184.1 PqqD family peptide modification chaperone [Bacteroidales bacterium]MDD4431514.1 PqqD family peptide modification chaperone [Bacteroidales bacterium]
MAKNKALNLFDLIPVVSERIRIETGEDRLLQLVFPRFRSAWMNRRLTPRGKSPYIHIKLEEHGSAVVQLIDGQRSVRDIALALAEHFGQEPGYEQRVAVFIEHLRRDGYISLKQP